MGRNTASLLRWGTLGILAFWLVVMAGLYVAMDYVRQPRAAVVAADGALVIPRGSDGHFRVAGSINGQPVRFMVDTGASLIAVTDALAQLQRLVPKNFLTAAPWPQLAHFARYLKAITARLDKVRADPARDAAKLAELRPQEQRYWRLVAERKGQVDARMQELRWLLEELRVSFFAQELRTPQPVSVKRLDKTWAQLNQ